MAKLKIGIFDMTDCEGCEVVMAALGKKLVDVLKYADIVEWRLGQKKVEVGAKLDLAIIEGAPITQAEIDQIKEVRARTGIVVALGACAALGGIPAIVTKEDREKMYKIVYGDTYKPRGIDSLPLSAYIKVDFSIHGCPVDGDEVVRVLSEVIAGKMPKYRDYSMCYDCKQKENSCRLLDQKACLGPITQGGCKAICVSGGLPCYGCFAPRKSPNTPALLKILRRYMNEKQVYQLFETFLKTTEEIKKL